MDTAFRQVRGLAILIVLSSISFAGYVTWRSYRLVARVESRVYVLAAGKALEAFASDRRDNLSVEARDHVRTFHHYFFTLDPDDGVIQANLTRALYLADGSARDVYERLKENNYFAAVISGNISQGIEVDSVAVHTATSPYYFRCWARQTITRPSTVTTRSLLTEGYLREVSRSDNNPHGFLIEKWRTLENGDLHTEKRSL